MANYMDDRLEGLHWAQTSLPDLSGESVFNGLGHELRSGADAATILIPVHPPHSQRVLKRPGTRLCRAVEEESNTENTLK